VDRSHEIRVPEAQNILAEPSQLLTFFGFFD
jgi:hypothetical protein